MYRILKFEILNFEFWKFDTWSSTIIKTCFTGETPDQIGHGIGMFLEAHDPPR